METDQACTAQAPCLAGCSLWTVSGCKLAMGWGASRGGELARVTVLGYAGSVCYDQLVRPPRAVLDYNTRYSGITQDSMEEGVTTSLSQVQMDLIKILSSKDIMQVRLLTLSWCSHKKIGCLRRRPSGSWPDTSCRELSAGTCWP